MAKKYKTILVREEVYQKLFDIRNKEGKKSLTQTVSDIVNAYIEAKRNEA